ncbi:unnamed protein product [Rotaria sp. Silwood1]|nr:unnamed protein product [Rotaria sp. Silwood1]CAF1650065.1 unnamed protein product [Rotaria sp. Silwood1]
MFKLDVLIDTSVLPSNIMLLRDEKFIDFVKEEAGDAAAELLEIQGINCVKSLLMTADVFAIMNVKSKSLDDLKKKYGYMLDDNTFVVQPGVQGNIEYLIDLLKQKCVDDAKLVKFSKRNELLSSLDNTTGASSTITKSNSIISSNTSSETMTSKSFNLSINEHKIYIIDTLNNWFESNKSKYNFSHFTLIEGQHYFISILSGANDMLKGNIKCCCGKWLSLTLRRGKFQMSNFYGHLQDSRNGNICNTIKEMKNNPQSTLSSSTNNQQSFTPSDYVSEQTSPSTNNQQPFTISENVYQQTSSPNRVPNISPPITIQSNSTLSMPSSISLSIDDDGTTITQSSLATKRQVKRKAQAIESSCNTRESTKRTRT